MNSEPAWKRRRWIGALVAILFVATLPLLVVRGVAVAAPEASVSELVTRLRLGSDEIKSQEDLNTLGALAHRIVSESGRTPGPFYVLFLSELDWLEKLRHLVHAPFSGLDDLYCDIWIHSVSTYGRRERTWGIRPSTVRPAKKLWLLLFLVDRLKREKTALQERLGAPAEALAGMELYTVPGRARVWHLVLAAAQRSPQLLAFLEPHLAAYAWDEEVDTSEFMFWAHLAARPTRGQVEALAQGSLGPPPDPLRPEDGAASLRGLVLSYGAPHGSVGSTLEP